MNNQREIKFRAWVDNANRMFGPFTLKELSDGRISVDEPDGRGYIFLNESDLMQYTGLKDKNGKEIYEGDILHAPLEEKDGPWAYPLIFTVEWDSFSYEDEYENNGTGHWCEGYDFKAFEPETCEVIGNIYESPELLAGKL